MHTLVARNTFWRIFVAVLVLAYVEDKGLVIGAGTCGLGLGMRLPADSRCSCTKVLLTCLEGGEG